jgi:predicted aspartyl protease
MALVTDLKLLPSDGAYLTPAFLNDQPTTMLLDTGAFATIITRTAAARLHLSLHETGAWAEGIGGRQDLYEFSAKNFRIGQLHGNGLVLGASDVGLQSEHFNFDGLFGADFLSGYDVDFDLPDNKIRLFKILAGCGTYSANLDEPLYAAPLVQPIAPFDSEPHVNVVIDGVRLNAIVDSGSDDTVIYRNAARRLGLRLQDLKADKHAQAMGVGPEARNEVRHIMAPIQIGEVTISNLPVSIIDQRSDGDSDMLLGRDFFSRVHVWLSFHSRSLIMQYPPKSSPKLKGE